MVNVNHFEKECGCIYKEERYCVRDNGAVLRYTPASVGVPLFSRAHINTRASRLVSDQRPNIVGFPFLFMQRFIMKAQIIFECWHVLQETNGKFIHPLAGDLPTGQAGQTWAFLAL